MNIRDGEIELDGEDIRNAVLAYIVSREGSIEGAYEILVDNGRDETMFYNNKITVRVKNRRAS